MAELTTSGGTFIAQDSPPSGPVKVSSYRQVSALATSIDSIVLSNDGATPSVFTGLELAPTPGSEGVLTIDPLDGTITNTSGEFLVMGGNVAFQPSKTGGGVAVIEVASESAFDGVNFAVTDITLRNWEIPNNGESFLSSPAALLLPPGAKTRFLAWNTGAGTITLLSPQRTVKGQTVNGASVSLELHGYTIPT